MILWGLFFLCTFASSLSNLPVSQFEVDLKSWLKGELNVRNTVLASHSNLQIYIFQENQVADQFLFASAFVMMLRINFDCILFSYLDQVIRN